MHHKGLHLYVAKTQEKTWCGITIRLSTSSYAEKTQCAGMQCVLLEVT